MGNSINKESPVILFDGMCNLCSSFVQFVIRHDKKQVFSFASLQSDFGEKILIQNGLNKSDYSSFVFYFNKKIYTKSTAALMVAKMLGGLIGILYIFIFIPRFIRDFIYDFVAKNRYRWFGKKTTCWMPQTGALK